MRVPGTPWIIASGMTEGASLTLIDSRNGAYSAVRPKAKHDKTFANCATPPDATQGGHTRPAPASRRSSGRSTLYAVGHGAREAIEVFDVDATSAKPTIAWKGLCPDARGARSEQRGLVQDDGSLVATVLISARQDLCRPPSRRSRPARSTSGRPARRASSRSAAASCRATTASRCQPDGKEIFVVSSGFQTIVAFAAHESDQTAANHPPAAFHPRQRPHGRGRPPSHGRHEKRRARMRRAAERPAFAGEALDLPARLHGASRSTRKR